MEWVSGLDRLVNRGGLSIIFKTTVCRTRPTLIVLDDREQASLVSEDSEFLKKNQLFDLLHTQTLARMTSKGGIF